MPNTLPARPERSSGLLRVARAIRFSVAGLQHAAVNEAAVREELIALALLLPVAAALPVTSVEHLLLVLPLMLLLMVELLNSAIERTVDRASPEHHPLAAQAKDMASAAVLIAVLMAGLSWAVIAGPIAIAWFRT